MLKCGLELVVQLWCRRVQGCGVDDSATESLHPAGEAVATAKRKRRVGQDGVPTVRKASILPVIMALRGAPARRRYSRRLTSLCQGMNQMFMSNGLCGLWDPGFVGLYHGTAGVYQYILACRMGPSTPPRPSHRASMVRSTSRSPFKSGCIKRCARLCFGR